ncbi:hypothetical protein Taro_014753 [Colocasia esculenta]|uniref:Uncharacterized protein n=1 Tax=Colocasia esculenta TaxID=4460 RepID=A0A843UFQ2_COLES|nr:hypothetical protein [Colocasia esculenta]
MNSCDNESLPEESRESSRNTGATTRDQSLTTQAPTSWTSTRPGRNNQVSPRERPNNHVRSNVSPQARPPQTSTRSRVHKQNQPAPRTLYENEPTKGLHDTTAASFSLHDALPLHHEPPPLRQAQTAGGGEGELLLLEEEKEGEMPKEGEGAPKTRRGGASRYQP